ncbi:MAG: AEC family transporter [Phycisphaeraceae bacterium]
MLASMGDIFLLVILPILLIVGLGALVQHYKPMSIPTLSLLNIYLLVPAFLFVKIYESRLALSEIGWIVLGAFLPMALLGLPMYLVLRRCRAGGNTIAALVVGGLVCNAGNYGLPLAELLYGVRGLTFPGMQTPADGPAVQALVVMTSNFTIWCVGYFILALASGRGMKQAAGYFKLPMLWVLIAAFSLRAINQRLYPAGDPTASAAGGNLIPAWMMYPLQSVGQAVVPVALITLGAQLRQRARWPRWSLIGPVLSVKLLILPAVTALVVWAMGLWPWPGAQLVIAAAAPTAVNTLLLTLELEGDADLAADCVFWTTLISAVTVTVVIVVVTYAAGGAVG